MTKRVKVAMSLGGTVVLAGSALTGAWAKAPGPLSEFVRPLARHFTVVKGSLQINNVLKVKKNTSIYGVVYAHGSEQVWKGLLVREGLRADTINDTGPLQSQSATIANSLQAGAITGTSIATTKDANIGGTLAVSGRIASNGVDGGAGGLTTTGAVSAGSISASSLSTTGNIAVGGTISTTGSVTVAGGMTISGNLNLSNANVTGLNLSSLNLNGATVNSFNVGAASGTVSPLNVSANGRTATVGVNSNGALIVDSLATNGAGTIGGSLTVAGSGGVSTGLIQAPTVNGGALGSLTLQGSAISLNAPVTLGNQSDLSFTSGTSGASSHILANNDADIAGKVVVTVNAGAVPSAGYSTSVTFAKPYSNEPAVSLTPASDPNVGGNAPKWWITPVTNSNGQYTGFTVHLYPPTAVNVDNGYNASFYYSVIGINR
ncbi:MAG: hypothetical protein ACR2JC_00150 [Chloroflexota bacterium]|nr:MAG: hypothetical protein DLM70_02140 [Chloroflexota bacterium]